MRKEKKSRILDVTLSPIHFPRYRSAKLMVWDLSSLMQGEKFYPVYPSVAEKQLDRIRRWPTARRVFLQQDIFSSDVPKDCIKQILDVMRNSPTHRFVVTTRNAERLVKLLSSEFVQAARQTHIWCGVRIDNEPEDADRLNLLRQVPAAVKFASINDPSAGLAGLDLTGIDAITVHADTDKAVEPERIEGIRQECLSHRIPFFFRSGLGGLPSEIILNLHGRHCSGSATMDAIADIEAPSSDGIIHASCSLVGES